MSKFLFLVLAGAFTSNMAFAYSGKFISRTDCAAADNVIHVDVIKRHSTGKPIQFEISVNGRLADGSQIMGGAGGISESDFAAFTANNELPVQGSLALFNGVPYQSIHRYAGEIRILGDITKPYVVMLDMYRTAIEGPNPLPAPELLYVGLGGCTPRP